MNYVSRPIVKLDRLFFGKGLNSARDQRMYRECSLKTGHRAGRSAAIIAARIYLNKKNAYISSRRKEKHQFSFNDLDCYIVKSSRSLKKKRERPAVLSFERAVGVGYSELRKLQLRDC